MSFFTKLLDFGIKALDAYVQATNNNQQATNEAQTNEHITNEPLTDEETDNEEDEYEEEETENELDHEFFILNKYISSIPKVHLNKLIEQLEYAKYDHSPYQKQNRENRKRWYKQIKQTINKFAIPYHRQKAQTAYSTICNSLGLMELPSYELSYIFRHDSNLTNDIRSLCDPNNMLDIKETQSRYATVVILNLISYEELY